jgi:hypothetical protein
MENSNIWIAVVTLLVMVGFFLVAYYSISKPKTNSIVVAAPRPLSFPPASEKYVVDTSYHYIQPAPQISGMIPTNLPTVVAGYTSTEGFATTELPSNTKLPVAESGDVKLPSTPVAESVSETKTVEGKLNPAIAALLLQKQNV